MGALSLIGLVWLWGTVQDVAGVPAVQAQDRQQAQFAADLTHMGVTHFYSGYWQCDSLIFLSHERLTCGVVFDNLQPGLNRYTSYWTIVHADPCSAYAFPLGSAAASEFAHQTAQANGQYTQQQLDGYVLFLPKSADCHWAAPPHA